MAQKAARQARRNLRRARRRIHSFKGFNTFLRLTVGPAITSRYNVHGENLDVIRDLKPPYLILANHTSTLDPFFVNKFIPGVIHYVVSDANFRNPIVNLGLTLVGSIPKTKAMSDLDTIRNIMQVTKAQGVVGIFPEGQNSWDGATLPLVYATAKLVKVLKVPVLIANVSGAFLSRPRWARNSRRGRVVVRYDLAFSATELAQASVDEIDQRIRTLLDHNEIEENRTARQRFLGRRRAEYLEIALFICPSCGALGTLRSKNNILKCKSCGYAVSVDRFGLFRAHSGVLRFDSIYEWNRWQQPMLTEMLDEYSKVSADAPFMMEESVEVYEGFQDRPLEPLGNASLALYKDRIEAKRQNGQRFSFPIADIRGINIQNKERLEFYCNERLIRIQSTDPRGCTYKWDLAVRHLQSA